MAEQITRGLHSGTYGLTTALPSAEIPYEEYSSGEVFIPAGSPITTLTWFAAPRQADQPAGGGGGQPQAQTFLAAQDAAGAAVTQTVAAAKAYPIPAALAGAAAITATVNSAGSVQVCLKS